MLTAGCCVGPFHPVLTARNGDRCCCSIGLNPSRADGRRDDPTLRRLQGFAHHWGYHHLAVLNLFARISPSPSLLRRCSEPIGADNDLILRSWFQALGSTADMGSLAGSGGLAAGFRQRGEAVWKMLNDVSDQPGVLPPSICDWLDQSGRSPPPPLASK